jgi:hypothetical protein
MNNTKIVQYAVIATLVVFVGLGLEAEGARRALQKQLAHQIATEDKAVQQLKTRAKVAEHARDTLTHALEAQATVVAASRTRADVAERIVASRRGAFRVDTGTKFMVGSDSSADSTQYGSIERVTDGKVFPIPAFFLATMHDMNERATSQVQLREGLEKLLAQETARATDDEKILSVKDSVIAAQDSAIVLRDKRRPSRFGFRSGVVAGVTAAVLIANPSMFVRAGRWFVSVIH